MKKNYVHSIKPTRKDIAKLKHLKMVEEAGSSLVKLWIKSAPKQLEEHEKEFVEFKKELHEIWGELLNLLDILLWTSLFKGEEFNRITHPEVPKDHMATFRVINYAFGRGCQIGREIHLLLSGGFADGAEARWRTLHEIVAVSAFVIQYGEDTAIRYIAHATRETSVTLDSYQKRHNSEGINAVSDEEVKHYREELDKLRKILGGDFGYSEWDWGAKALGKKRVNFQDIEEAVGLDYLQPVYKDASSNVHASSRGTGIRLGLPNPDNEILVGYSFHGIGEVAFHTAFSMLVLLENMLRIKPTDQNEIHVSAVYQLLDAIRIARYKAQDFLEKKDQGETSDKS